MVEIESQSEEPYVLRLAVPMEQGLHARPAAMLAQLAQKYDSDISLVSGDQKVDAKSILDILSLAAGKGCELEIRADGADAREAAEAVEALFNSRFNGA